MNDLTLIVPFYRNCAMLKRQAEEWNKYPPGVKVICVDDGSPEPALPIIMETLSTEAALQHRVMHGAAIVECYRIDVDIPWNREGARNLGAHVATTDWIVQIDIDHILPAGAAAKLLEALSLVTPHASRLTWFRFPRWRVGKADETRKKDKIPDDVEYGEIHPHVDSYLIRRDLYWKTGGYDEDYVGHLGGGNMFLRRLEKLAGPPELLPAPIRLEVYTRDVIKDASDWSLSRDKSENSKRRRMKEANGDTTPKNPLRFMWKREL